MPADEALIFPLLRTHNPQNFSSGKPALDTWLHNFAFQAEQSKSARTYVSCIGDEIIGYYSLVVSEMPRVEASRLSKGLSRHPVPTIKLARLAVDQRQQGRGLGAALLIDALERAVYVSIIAGARAVVVEPIDIEADGFYSKFGFEQLNVKTDSRLGYRFLLIKDIEKLLLPASRHHETDHRDSEADQNVPVAKVKRV